MNLDALFPSPAIFLIIFGKGIICSQISCTHCYSSTLLSQLLGLLMILDDLPCEIVTRCFSCLSTELLTDIILLDNIPDNLLEAAAINLNRLWYSKGIRRYKRVANINDYYETDFDRFSRIHKILENKSHKCPLWFHYTWKTIPQMYQSLDKMNLVYHGQNLAIHAELKDWIIQNYPILSYHDLNLKVTCLSLSGKLAHDPCIDLNTFPKLETFYGDRCEIIVDHNHPSLKNLYLRGVTFSSLPVDLKKLVARYCYISMKEDHPKLEALTTLVLENTRGPANSSSLVRVLWNENLETFSYINENATNIDEFFSMIGSKVQHFGFASPSLSRVLSMIPTLLRTLNFEHSHPCVIDNRDKLYDLTAFTHMTSLTLKLPRGLIDTSKLPPNLLELSIYNATFQDLERISFPSRIVDLELTSCHITLTTTWLKPARLKRLSLHGNDLSSFRAFLPCCEYLNLSYNRSLTDLEIEAPVLERIDLYHTNFTSIPKLPDSLQVLCIGTSDLRLCGMPELPSSLKVLRIHGSLNIQDYTFPPSIQVLDFFGTLSLKMSGVKFAKGSRLKELILSDSGLPSLDWDDLTSEDYEYSHEGLDFGGDIRLSKINDGMIELPPGLRALKMRCMGLRYIDDFTIPQSVTLLDLRENHLTAFEVKSHIEIFYLYDNPIELNTTVEDLELNFVVHKDLELRVLDLAHIGLKKFSFDMVKAEKLEQLRLGSEVEMIDLSKMPANFQILEHIVRGSCTVIEPDTGQSYIYERIPYSPYL